MQEVPSNRVNLRQTMSDSNVTRIGKTHKRNIVKSSFISNIFVCTSAIDCLPSQVHFEQLSDDSSPLWDFPHGLVQLHAVEAGLHGCSS